AASGGARVGGAGGAGGGGGGGLGTQTQMYGVDTPSPRSSYQPCGYSITDGIAGGGGGAGGGTTTTGKKGLGTKKGRGKKWWWWPKGRGALGPTKPPTPPCGCRPRPA